MSGPDSAFGRPTPGATVVARAGEREEEVFSNEFAGFENDASRISVYMPLVIPGLLQTPAYIAALLELGPREPAWRERARSTPGCAASASSTGPTAPRRGWSP